MMDLMFHVVLECEGIHPEEGDQAATNITEEFSKNPWHHNPKCTWDGTTLRLEVDTDFDSQGLALRDEFSDAIVACVVNAEYTNMRVVSAAEVR